MTIALALLTGLALGALAQWDITRRRLAAVETERDRLNGIDAAALAQENAVLTLRAGRYRREMKRLEVVGRNLAGLLATRPPIPLGPARHMARRPRPYADFTYGSGAA